VIVIIATRQLRHETAVTGERTPVQPPGVGYSKRRRRRRQSQLEAGCARFKNARDEPVVAEPEAGD
jgi:hypothetical protein